MDQQLLIESAGGDSLTDDPLPNATLPDDPLPYDPTPNVPLPNIPLPNVPLPNVPLPNVPLPNVPLPEASLDGSISQGWTSPHIAEEVVSVAFGLGSRSCLVCFLCYNHCITAIDHYTCREVFGSLRVCFIYGFCIGFIILDVFYS